MKFDSNVCSIGERFKAAVTRSSLIPNSFRHASFGRALAPRLLAFYLRRRDPAL